MSERRVESEPARTSYQLNAQESIPDGIKRIVSEQISRAIWQLTDPPESRDTGVHDARKCFKKIRAVLRLVRDEIGKDVFKQENVFFRDIGRRLAPVRESAVLVQTFDRLCERVTDQLAPDAFGGVRDELVTKHRSVSRQILEDESGLAEIVASLQTARQRVADWPLVHNDFSALFGGLQRIYRRGRSGLAEAYLSSNPENFHEWRKWVKYLWYHVRILKALWPNQFIPLANELSDLADWLGDNHDLAELHLVVLECPGMFHNEAELPLLLDLIDDWRRELEALACLPGRRIYVEKPGAFVNRIATYWQIWHTEAGSV
jgi:CHAD domain-containing protein